MSNETQTEAGALTEGQFTALETLERYHLAAEREGVESIAWLPSSIVDGRSGRALVKKGLVKRRQEDPTQPHVYRITEAGLAHLRQFDGEES